MNRRMALSNVILMVASLAVGGATPVAAFAPPNPHCTASSSATVPSPTSSIIFLPWEPSSSATKTLSRKQARLLPLTRLQGNILHPAVSDAVKSSSSSSAGVGGIVFHHHNAHHVALAGSLWPVLQKLRLTPAKISAIWTNVAHITDWKGLAFLSTLAFGITPTAKYLYYRINKRKLQLLREELLENGDLEMAGELDDADDSRFFSTFESDGFHSALESGGKNTGLRSMAQMKRFGAVAFIDQISKVSLSVYAMDVISIMLTTVGFTFPKKCRISDNYAKIAYSVWAVNRLLRYKTVALCRLFRVDAENMGRIEIVDRLLNGIIATISTLMVLDWLDFKMNNAMTGLFAFGSAGTLAFTLASQGLVTQLLSGIFLMFSDKMYVGDSVVFGDGTSGRVMKLGWMETQLRDGNNIVTRVPNTLLASQKVSNISRIKQSQVKQTLRFHYKDASILPKVLEDIKVEIKKACPKLILDNSRPFRAFWTDYSEDHLEVMIDTHFNIAPFTDAYWINRQNVLMAITKAVTNYSGELVPKKSDMVLQTGGETE